MNIKIIVGLLRRIAGKFLCLIGDHDWTNRSQQGIPPDPVKREVNPVEYFKEYAAMYCSRCNKGSQYNMK